MSLLTSELVSAAEHRIGGPSSQAFTETLKVVNYAGRLFYSMHPWQMALNASALLDLVANVNTATLPSDFAALLGVTRTDGTLIERVTPARLLALRYGSQDATGTVESVSVVSLTELGLWRTPTSNESDAIAITYRARWVDKVAPTDVVPVSDFAAPLLIDVVREYAAGLEAGDWLPRYEAIKQSKFFRDIATMDGGLQPDLGQVLGRGNVLSTDWVENTTWGLS